ncbi:MAG: LuxR family transcriptional regulator [Maricaulaceae bacterium]
MQPPLSALSQNLTTLIHDTGQIGDFDDLVEYYIRLFTAQGVAMLSYHHLPPPGARDYARQLTVRAYGFPPDWVERYTQDELYLVDPIPKHALNATGPFWWSDARAFPDLSEAEHRYLDRLEHADFGDGLAIPVFGPHARNGYVGMGFGGPRPHLSPEAVRLAQLACQIGHLRYCDLLFVRLAPDAALSQREAEILEWIARGKSNAIISQIVGISNHTVDTYLRRIFAKLGVADRVNAVLRGIAVGAIG